MNTSELEYRKPLQWGEIDPYRRGRTHVGMWAWLLQRVSAVFIVFLLVLHLCFTYKSSFWTSISPKSPRPAA